MDLTIITVPWNVKDLVRENFNAIFSPLIPSPSPTSAEVGEGSFEFEVFAVDNDSHDGTVEMIREEFSQVKVIANKINLGFAKANNQAIRQASGRYILLLNPDMRVLPGTLENMVRWMDAHQEAGVAGCHLINDEGETVHQVRRFPTIWDQLAIVLKLPHLFPIVLNKYLMHDFDYSKEAEVDSIRGSFFMIRNTIVVTSPQPSPLEGEGESDRNVETRFIASPLQLDERYFIWFEEVDFCRQIKNKGLKIMYTPVVQCIDHVGKSFSQVKRGITQRYFRDSMLKYFKKWHPIWQYRILYLAWPVGIFLAWMGDQLKLKVYKVIKFVK